MKFPGNPEGKKALINEFVASNLCEVLDLPILKYNLIEVSLDNYKPGMDSDLVLISGTSFGTIYNDRILNVLNAGQVGNTVNKNDAIKIIIFDLLIGNNDRNKGNLMIDSNRNKLIMIDHTHIFELETIWDDIQLNLRCDDKFDVSKLNQYNYKNLFESIKYTSDFYNELNSFIIKVKSIKKEEIERIIDNIPKDWDITENEKISLTNYIYKRFCRVDEILEILNLKGGDINEFQS